MKENKLLLTLIILIILITSTGLYKRHINLEAEEFINLISKSPIFSDGGLSGEVVLKRRLKSTSGEIVMLADWGEDQVYIRAKNWRRKTWYRRAHLEMEVRVFDRERVFGIIE